MTPKFHHQAKWLILSAVALCVVAFVYPSVLRSAPGPGPVLVSNSRLDVDEAGFGLGTHSNTVIRNGGLELAETTPGNFVASGNWTSPEYDTGGTSLWHWFAAEQSMANFQNLLPNGSLENDTSPADGVADGWSYNASAVQLDTQHVTDGQKSLRIDPPNFPSGGAFHTLTPAIPMAGTQTIHALFRIAGDIQESGLSIYFAYYDTVAQVTRGSITARGAFHYAGEHFPDGTLLYLTTDATIPGNANSLKIGIATSGHGPTWLDDVRVFTSSYTTMETQTSNDNSNWTAWEAPRPFFDNQISPGSAGARYIRYRLNLTSPSSTTTPHLTAVHQTFSRAFPMPLAYGPMTKKFFSPNLEPTGTRGFVQAVNGHLQYEDGTRAKFWSAQDAAGDATDYTLAPGTTCSMMETMGFNMLKMDIGYWRAVAGVRADFYDLTWRDRFYQIVNACGDKGIHLYLRMYIEKRLVDSIGPGNPAEYNKFHQLGLGSEYFINPAFQQIIRDYMTDFLTYINPHTNKKLGVDPTIVAVEYFNEQGLLQAFFADRLHGTCLDPANPGPCQFPKDISPANVTILNDLWNTWLRDRYVNRAAIVTAWQQLGKVGLELNEDPWNGDGTTARMLYSERSIYSTARFRDTVAFYTATEEAFYTMMDTHIDGLRSSDGVKTLTVGTQTIGGVARAVTKALLGNDVMDVHNYIDLGNHTHQHQRDSVLRSPGYPGLAWSTRARSLQRPYTMSEHNQTGDSDFTGEMPATSSSYAAFQNYDMVTIFALNPFTVDDNTLIFNFDPIRWLQMPVASRLFLRDVRPAQKTISLEYTQTETLDIDTVQMGLIGLGAAGFLSGEYALLHQVGISTFSAGSTKPASQYISEQNLNPNPSNPYISDTGELSLNGISRVFTVTTAGTQGAVGALSATTQTLPNMTMATPATPLESLAIMATAIDTSNLATASNILLTATSQSQQTGIKYSIDKTITTTLGDRPALTVGVQATIRLKLRSTDFTVTALDMNGDPTDSVPVTVDGDWVEFELDPMYEALWYRIQEIPDTTAPAAVTDLQAP